jgi:flagella basal body P-ring formation protein FlgA
MMLAALTLGSCLAVGPASDQILAGDLSAAAPEWAALAPEMPIALAPAPGVQRVFRLPELRRLVQRWNLPAGPDRELCVARPVGVPDPARLLAAMQRQLPGARIEILEFSRQAAPDGELEFPLSGLRRSAEGAFWSGFVKYAGGHHFAVWARVRVQVAVARVVTKEVIPAGRTLEPAGLRLETREEFPATGYVTELGEAAGMAARRSIPAGTPILSEWLEAAKAVLRGDPVQVEIVNGGARLKLEAVAVSSGAIGDTILVLNPAYKRQFRARILSPGKARANGGSL